jgi:hypothetical protein
VQVTAGPEERQTSSEVGHRAPSNRITKWTVRQDAEHAAEPNRHATGSNRQVSCQAGCWTHRQTESPPNRIVKRAVTQDDTEPTRHQIDTPSNRHATKSTSHQFDTSPNRHATGSNRQASCQAGRHRADTLPNRHATKSTRRQIDTPPN